jgi:signal transduction histidine kinase
MKHRFARRMTLTFLISLSMFAILLAAIVLASSIVYVLVKIHWIPFDIEEGSIGMPFLYLACISLIVAAILVFLIGHAPANPMRNLIEGMDSLAHGDFSVRLNPGKRLDKESGPGKLCESFNTMASELEQTELLRSDFINNFSHEFKTPIVSIAGFAKILRKGALSKEKEQEYLQIIEEESLRLADLATQVLDVTRYENQQILREVASFNLAEQMRRAILLLDEKWQAKQLSFDLDLKEICIEANEEMLMQVWLNLLGNAIKFSDEGEQISICLKEKQDQIFVSVSNRGRQIAPENLERIFGKFFQEETSHASSGNGLGLAIVKRIIILHEGKIWAESSEKQTTFYMELPKEKHTS